MMLQSATPITSSPLPLQWLIPVWNRMLYSCTHMATVGFKWLKSDLPNIWLSYTATLSR